MSFNSQQQIILHFQIHFLESNDHRFKILCTENPFICFCIAFDLIRFVRHSFVSFIKKIFVFICFMISKNIFNSRYMFFLLCESNRFAHKILLAQKNSPSCRQNIELSNNASLNKKK